MDNYNIFDYAKDIYPNLLTKEERYVLEQYSSFMYVDINRRLRKHINCYEYLYVTILDKAISKFVCGEELTVYRNIGFRDNEKMNLFLKKLETGSFHEYAYMSTSLSMLNNLFGRDFRFIINVPAFYSGALIRELAMVKDENEYLISRDTNLLIEDISYNKEHDKHVLEPKILVKARVIK